MTTALKMLEQTGECFDHQVLVSRRRTEFLIVRDRGARGDARSLRCRSRKLNARPAANDGTSSS
jgi:hypothetical protein